MEVKKLKPILSDKYKSVLEDLDKAKSDVHRSYLLGMLNALDEILTLLRK